MSTPTRPSDHLVPKTISVFKEGYSWERLKRDMVSGLTVAMVAIPLSMAIAKASGASPDRGLVTAIIGGFLISLLGGSRFQIGGPAGAFIVVVASIIERQGYDGLLMATLMAGLAMIVFGIFRLGTYIKYIPHPVLVGFTAGIATIIFSSQIVDLFGLTLQGREPAALVPKLTAIVHALNTISPAAIFISAFSVIVILVLRRLKPHWPGFLIAIGLASLLSVLISHFGFSVETIGSRFGGIPNSLPAPQFPITSPERIISLIPDAATIAFLGAIESLLSAVVADGMTGRRHRSNMELIAQGVANIGTALFGGICATGTIARTATNVRAGGTSPVAGMTHSVVLLLLILFAAPLASYIPLASLGAILAIVSWNMAERAEFISILRRSWPDATILLATFLLTIFRDLTEGIAVGVILSAFIFMHRMAEATRVNGADITDTMTTDPDTITYRMEGPLFFGVASEIAEVLDRINEAPKRFVLDCSSVPLLDITGAHSLKTMIDHFHKQGTDVIFKNTNEPMRDALKRFGVLDHGARIES
jgi:SulP family sulfate permease